MFPRLNNVFARLEKQVLSSGLYKRTRSLIAGGQHNVSNLMYTIFTTATLAGYAFQQEVFKQPSAITRAALEQWRDEATDYARARQSTASTLLPSLVTASALYWLAIAAGQGMKQGFGNGQRSSADENDAQFKTWVRTARRFEPRRHSNLEGVTLPIDSLFRLPNGSRVYQPHDWERYPNPAEWVHCGHGLIYTQTATRQDLQRAFQEGQQRRVQA